MVLFDQEAANYDKWYETKIGEHADQVETECAFSLFKVRAGRSILEVGCGTGNFSIKLARQGALVTGVDISHKMLTIARKKAKQEKLNITFKKMDSLNLQFPDNYFDSVISMATIEFVSTPLKMISEMFRVVKGGGFILIGTINRASEWGRLYQEAEFQKKVKVFQHAYFKTPEELSKIRKEDLIAVKECLFIPPDFPESEISPEKEVEFALIRPGGFFCILWQKK
ncbi:MAG: class I SAM-dependent methyltransferase [Candidatus Atribacteria bacterium]|nr:class I SAM-dependent methyltransferase [Candidatus Atribacteria bacterium]